MQTTRSAGLQSRRFAGSSSGAAAPLPSRSWLRSGHAAGQRRSSAPTCHAAAVQSQQDLQQLLNWAGSNKAVVDKVAVADDIASDQPVYVAAKDIAAGDQVLAVPDSAWITPATAQQSSIGKFIQGQEPWLQLALLLLAERAAGSSSKLGPYLTALTGPSSVLMRSPLFWSEEELQLLQGTQLLESVRGYR